MLPGRTVERWWPELVTEWDALSLSSEGPIWGNLKRISDFPFSMTAYFLKNIRKRRRFWFSVNNSVNEAVRVAFLMYNNPNLFCFVLPP